jgi:hypothetical protein
VRDLLRAAAGPVICAVVVIGLLAAWTGTGGGGTLTRVRLQVTRADIPMRAFTPQKAAEVHAAITFVTIRNVSGFHRALLACAVFLLAAALLALRATNSRGEPAAHPGSTPAARDQVPAPELTE